MIEIRNLKKRYSDGTRALNGITAEIDDKVATIIGRNGAGKTTLMRILSTQLLQTSGSATINGYDVVKEANKIRKMIVSIPQEASTVGYLTPMEHLKIYLTARGSSIAQAEQDAAAALKALELWNARSTPCDMLSGGMKRKVFVAMALAANAEIVFLDEPTTGLDPVSRFEVWSSIKMLKSNLILTTHYMDEAQELSKKVIMIDDGKIKEEGTPDALLRRFSGKVRAESQFKDPSAKYKIGNTYIRYISPSEAEEYVKKGYSIKRPTLDDLFIVHGVELEA
ncbi:MAG: ABC transporter ATP-binding protein [Candidatus Micrarchaeaceae archaeon]